MSPPSQGRSNGGEDLLKPIVSVREVARLYERLSVSVKHEIGQGALIPEIETA